MHDRVEGLYREGIENKLLMPQFHGREHVNIERWLIALQGGDRALQFAFDQSMFSVHAEQKPAMVNELMDALDADSIELLSAKKQIIKEGLQLFNSIWGFSSKSFIAPCYIYDTDLEPFLFAEGVEYLQGMVIQLQPVANPGYQYRTKYHYQGQMNRYGQRHLVRNAFFEPSTNQSFDWVGDCMHRIETAFRWNKPAIICSHRVNFIGFIREENRSANLELLHQLLKQIKQKWPDVEFMSSDKLGDAML